MAGFRSRETLALFATELLGLSPSSNHHLFPSLSPIAQLGFFHNYELSYMIMSIDNRHFPQDTTRRINSTRSIA